MRFDSLKDALIYELQDLYNAEKQLVTALPLMIAETTSLELKKAFTDHLQETENHVTRLTEIFSFLGISPSAEKCEAMQGLIKEGREVLTADGNPHVKDALLIGAAQRIEHYEMAGYGTARTFARILGFNDVAELLQQTLYEEGEANKKLVAVAEGGWVTSGVNKEARASAGNGG